VKNEIILTQGVKNMQSSKYEYRILTQPENRFKVEFRDVGNDWFSLNAYADTFGEAVDIVRRNVAADNFIPQVLEIPSE
jgi:hypothetical protein